MAGLAKCRSAAEQFAFPLGAAFRYIPRLQTNYRTPTPI
jgi:hypothetical protein